MFIQTVIVPKERSRFRDAVVRWFVLQLLTKRYSRYRQLAYLATRPTLSQGMHLVIWERRTSVLCCIDWVCVPFGEHFAAGPSKQTLKTTVWHLRSPGKESGTATERTWRLYRGER
jgi:hypothetical protein